MHLWMMLMALEANAYLECLASVFVFQAFIYKKHVRIIQSLQFTELYFFNSRNQKLRLHIMSN